MIRRAWLWPAGLVALLVGSAAANIAFMLVATGDPSFAVERNYYQKALSWDETMAQAQRNVALGWTVAAGLSPAEGGRGQMRLSANVTDRDGTALDGATLSVEAFHNARAGQVREAVLAPVGDGYTSLLEGGRPGLWELRFRVTRGKAVFTQVLTRELTAAR